MSSRLVRCVFGGAVASLAAVACAQDVSLTPSKDATLFEPDLIESQLSGGGGQLFIGRTGSGRVRRSMLFFDIAGSIPAGATITSAELRVRVAQTQAGSVVATVHRMLADWGEGVTVGAGGGAAGAAAQPGDATWNFRFYPNSPWNTAGGDFDPAIIATKFIGPVGDYTFSSLDLASAVQNMLDHPENNFGLLIVGDEISGVTAKRINSREWSVANERPTLTVTYTPPCLADWNHDGGVDGDDVIQFFAEWDAGDADFDGSGGTDGDDVIAFFAQWDSSCN